MGCRQGAAGISLRSRGDSPPERRPITKHTDPQTERLLGPARRPRNAPWGPSTRFDTAPCAQARLGWGRPEGSSPSATLRQHRGDRGLRCESKDHGFYRGRTPGTRGTGRGQSTLGGWDWARQASLLQASRDRKTLIPAWPRLPKVWVRTVVQCYSWVSPFPCKHLGYAQVLLAVSVLY